MRTFPLKTLLIFGAVALLVIALLGWRSGCQAAGRKGAEADVAVTTGKQLDKVTTETAAVRQDQEEKARAVEQIEGSDQALPPGYGEQLERVRRGG